MKMEMIDLQKFEISFDMEILNFGNLNKNLPLSKESNVKINHSLSEDLTDLKMVQISETMLSETKQRFSQDLADFFREKDELSIEKYIDAIDHNPDDAFEKLVDYIKQKGYNFVIMSSGMLDFFENKIPLEIKFTSLTWVADTKFLINFCSNVSGINFFVDSQKKWSDKRIFLGKTGCFEYNYEVCGPKFNPEASMHLAYNYNKDQSKCESIIFLNKKDPNYPSENRDIKLKYILS